MKHYDVIIVGAGTAGLSARKEVAKKTENYLVIDNGPLGTTCARVGCMPSKVLIQAANDFYRRKVFINQGILGAESLSLDSKMTMKHVRKLRDRFVSSVKDSMLDWEDKICRKKAVFVDAQTIDIEGEKISADKFIIAVGSRPVIPKPWLNFKSHLVDTDNFFELESLPKKMAVIGLGVIGTELGQALSRLGVEVVGFSLGRGLAGATDPEIQDYIIEKLSKEMSIHLKAADLKGINDQNKLVINVDSKVYEVDKALISIGRRSNLDLIGLENLGLKLNTLGQPEVSLNRLFIKEAPHIFLPGDANGDRPILHEAADEGRISGYNAVNTEQCFKRRTTIGITFSDPNAAVVGLSYAHLKEKAVDFKIGKVSFEGQGRSIVKLKEVGLLHIYVEATSAEILGAEIFAPEGEHLAHLIAWAISLKLTVFEALKLPFYHPVIEEGLRTALRQCANQLNISDQDQELIRCQDAPIR